MLIDPKDAEIARLNRKIELLRVYQDIVWEPPVGYWQDRAEKAEAERDKVVSEAQGISDHVLAYAKVDTDNPVEAASRMAQRILELTAERDAALALVQTAYKAGYYQAECGLPDHANINTAASAALDRRDAQMRAEGLRKAAEIADKAAKINDSENGGKDTPSGNLMWGVVCDIIAAAEKEAPHD